MSRRERARTAYTGLRLAALLDRFPAFPDGRLALRFERRWGNGTTLVQMEMVP